LTSRVEQVALSIVTFVVCFSAPRRIRASDLGTTASRRKFSVRGAALVEQISRWQKRSFVPLGRMALFVIYFYFGALKLIGQSPAAPLAVLRISAGFDGGQ
jgi:hypothetical protein